MKQIIQSAKNVLCAVVGLGDIAFEKIQQGITHLSRRGKKRIDEYQSAAQTRASKRQEQSNQLCLKQLFESENPQKVLQKAFDSLTPEQYQAVSKALEDCQRASSKSDAEEEKP